MILSGIRLSDLSLCDLCDVSYAMQIDKITDDVRAAQLIVASRSAMAKRQPKIPDLDEQLKKFDTRLVSPLPRKGGKA